VSCESYMKRYDAGYEALRHEGPGTHLLSLPAGVGRYASVEFQVLLDDKVAPQASPLRRSPVGASPNRGCQAARC
jgi:hypothetical protein